MARTIHVDLSVGGINAAIEELQEYRDSISDKAREVCRRLAELGATSASLGFAQAVYTGPEQHDITVDETETGYVIRATGGTVLFIEFGAGITYGYGHPQAADFGMGPGTYPGKGHWDDPKGWYLPGGEHTFGNPPNMPMYNAAQDLKREIERVAREVFGSD